LSSLAPPKRQDARQHTLAHLRLSPEVVPPSGDKVNWDSFASSDDISATTLATDELQVKFWWVWLSGNRLLG